MKTMNIIAKVTGLIAAVVIGVIALGAGSASAAPPVEQMAPGLDEPCLIITECLAPIDPPIQQVPTSTPTDEPTPTPTATPTDEPTPTPTDEPPTPTDEPPAATDEPPEAATVTPECDDCKSGVLPNAGTGEGASQGANWGAIGLAGLVVAGLAAALAFVAVSRRKKSQLS